MLDDDANVAGEVQILKVLSCVW